ncbi:hypothetical protein T4E_6831 [Trichinella pseudospiralis]|uniref:Uncharacterized protein n=1 Tax=Trichinella pseudospiralis TaxID=6337 RepID=A0A0V0Y9S6_TRIPS|nr:hypothetical protein T4E_6831 [Trichinella pseudospiralis]
MAHFQSQFYWYNFGSFPYSLFDLFGQFTLVTKEPSIEAASVSPFVSGYFTIGKLILSMKVVSLAFGFPRRGCSFLFPLEHWTRTNKQQQQKQQQTLAKVKKALQSGC